MMYQAYICLLHNMHALPALSTRLVSGMDNATIVEQFYDKSNWCIVLEKRWIMLQEQETL